MVLTRTDRFGDPVWVREYEYRVGETVIVPILAQRMGIQLAGKRILDLGCGSGGLLWACAQAGSVGIGIDIDESRIATARRHPSAGAIPQFLVGDILDPLSMPDGSFDVVLFADVIEHLIGPGEVESVLRMAARLVSERRGRLFVSFPPYLSPFGGHQAGWPICAFLPWVHLWPKAILHRWISSEYAKFVGEGLNHLTISAFERTIAQCGLHVEARLLYLIRPEYSIRYNIPAIPQVSILQKIPPLMELLTTGVYYLLSVGDG